MSAFEYVALRSRELGFDPRDIRGPRKWRQLVKARITIARELRGEPFGLSYPEVARALGRKDHVSAIWWVRGGRPRK